MPSLVSPPHRAIDSAAELRALAALRGLKITQIADHMGASRQTTMRAFRGDSRITRERRRQILDAILTLGGEP